MKTPDERRRALGDRWLRWHRDMEKCLRCGRARCNVVHESDPDRSPLGPDYFRSFADEMHNFAPSGGWVDGYDRVTGYIPLPEAMRLARGLPLGGQPRRTLNLTDAERERRRRHGRWLARLNADRRSVSA